MPAVHAQDSKPCDFNFSCLDGCSEFHYKGQNLAGPGVGPRTHACRICTGADIPDDIMLSVLARALPKAIQQHVQLQLNETSNYDQMRAMVVSYERTTTSWSPGKIHSELGILPQSQNQSFNQSSNNTGLAPMEIGRFEKGKNKGKSKGKNKGKETTKGKGKNKSDKGKGKSNNKGSTRTATASDQCLYCGKYRHFKRDCWKLHGRGEKNVNQVESNASNNAASASSNSSTSSGATSSSGVNGSVRLFTGLHESHGPIIEDLDEDVEIKDLTGYDSFGACNMFSQVSTDYSNEWFGWDDTAEAEGVYTACCSRFDCLILTMTMFGHV